MNSITFSHRIRQFFLLSMLIFTIDRASGQNNPYQAECARFESNSALQCAPYSNCRLMGGSSDECAIKAEAINKKPVTSLKEVMDKEAADKTARSQWASEDRQKRQQQDLQQQQQQLQQQYQQIKK